MQRLRHEPRRRPLARGCPTGRQGREIDGEAGEMPEQTLPLPSRIDWHTDERVAICVDFWVNIDFSAKVDISSGAYRLYH